MRGIELAWPRQATGQLRLPALCAYTGGPAEEGVLCQFFLPVPSKIARYTRMVTLYLPATHRVARRVRTLRLRLLIGVPALMVCGLLLAILSGIRTEATGSLIWILLEYVAIALMCSAIAWPFVALLSGAGWVRGRVGFDDWVRVRRVNRAFADACIALNPPGMVRVGIPPPRQPQQQPRAPARRGP